MASRPAPPEPGVYAAAADTWRSQNSGLLAEIELSPATTPVSTLL
jgi:hypothetical protein